MMFYIQLLLILLCGFGLSCSSDTSSGANNVGDSGADGGESGDGGDAEDGGGDNHPRSLSELGEELVEAVCSAIFEGKDPTLSVASFNGRYANEAECLANLTPIDVDPYWSLYAAAVENGMTTYDPEQAANCANALEAEYGRGQHKWRYIKACQQVFLGTVLEGEFCESDASCGEGEFCMHDGGLNCQEHRCQKIMPDDADENACTSVEQCANGEWCDGGNPWGYCVDITDAEIEVGLGERCVNSTDDGGARSLNRCVAGLTCMESEEVPGQFGSVGVCSPLLIRDEPCVWSPNCKAGLACQEGVCTDLSSIGERCKFHIACKTGRCFLANEQAPHRTCMPPASCK